MLPLILAVVRRAVNEEDPLSAGGLSSSTYAKGFANETCTRCADRCSGQTAAETCCGACVHTQSVAAEKSCNASSTQKTRTSITAPSESGPTEEECPGSWTTKARTQFAEARIFSQPDS